MADGPAPNATPKPAAEQVRDSRKQKAQATRCLGLVWSSAQEGNAAALRGHLRKLGEIGLSVNSRPRGRAWRVPPLFVAACNDHAAAVRELVAAKAGVNTSFSQPSQNRAGWRTPLFTAAAHGSCAALDALVEAKAAVDQGGVRCGGDGRSATTPLWGAVGAGEADAVGRLLLAKAAANHPGCVAARCMTPLELAATRGHTATMQPLLQAKADPHKDGQVLVAAATGGHLPAVLALLAAKVSVNNGQPLRHTAVGTVGSPRARRQRDAIAWALLRAKATVDDVDHHGATVLWTAAGHKGSAVEVLLRAKADTNNTGGPEGCPPLWRAAVYGHADNVRLLLAAKARLDGRGHSTSFQPLLCDAAASIHSAAVVPALLQAKASVHAANGRGQTPLWHAAHTGSDATLSALLAAKAAVDQWAAADANSTPLLMAVQRPWTAHLELLLQAKADVNLPNAAGRTPLLGAAETGWAWAVTLLLRAKAAVNQVAPDGRTPLIVVAQRNFDACVAELLKAKAAVNHADAFGRSALWHAAAKDCAEAATALLDAKAHVHQVAEASRGAHTTAAPPTATATTPTPPTPLLAAIEAEALRTVTVLLRANATMDGPAAQQARCRFGGDVLDAVLEKARAEAARSAVRAEAGPAKRARRGP